MALLNQKLTLLALAAFPAAAFALEPEPYAVVMGGYGMMANAPAAQGSPVTASFGGAPYGAFGGGVQFENLRLQGEAFYFQTSIDSFERINTTAQASGGDLSGWGMTANLHYEFLGEAKLRPFLGAGFGFASLERDDVSFTINGAQTSLAAEERTDFVLQADIGVSYYPTPELSIAPAYRYLSIGGVEDDLLSSDMHLFTLRGAFHF